MTETKTITPLPINLGSPGEDISKKDLHSIIKRFKNINQLRQQRVQSFFQPRQQVFLDTLPLLFHLNHPLFPGFISHEVPAGIPDYTPNKQEIRAAKQFSSAFSYKRKALLSYPIQGIFLMGSVGSIAFSKSSDMDIWLCHEPSLSNHQLKELQQKASGIEKWAEILGLEIHFFLVNSESFREGDNIPLSSESSGNTQHYLLLEEFYRTAIYIAGRILAWWLIPPSQENSYANYLQHLIKNRFISKNEVIDLGSLEKIPAEEFISATLWHIYKSLNSPHKSLLKLFLMESYASEYPSPQWLCYDLKNSIYQGSIDIDNLDPYLLIYKKVEDYLQKDHSSQRLSLVRQCFYLKIIGASRSSLDSKSRAFREAYMQDIAKQWCWPEGLLATFNKQKFWDIKKASQEHIIVRSQLKHCLRMVLKLAGNHVAYNYKENQDLKLLSRKLHVSLERRPGKVEIITTQAAIHKQENSLSIIESFSQSTVIWSLYSGQQVNTTLLSNNLIKQQSSLIQLLAWMATNGLYNKHIQLSLSSTSLSISKSELHKILSQIYLFISQNLKLNSDTLDTYNKPNIIIASLNIINLGLSNIAERDDGMMILSERSDPFSYGNDHHCFVYNIARISISSWGEVSTYQYLGADGFFNCISHIFNTSQQPITKKTLKTICFTPTRANSIILRCNTIFEHLTHYFSSQENSFNRYILGADNLTYIFQQKNKQLHHWSVESEEQLLQELSNPNDEFSGVYFDGNVLNNPLIPYLYSLNKTQTIQFFYLSENNSITIFIIDELGALFTQKYHNASYSQVLNNYLSFLESISNHVFQNTDIQLKLYKINKKSPLKFSVQIEKWTSSIRFSDLPVSVIVEEEATGSSYLIYCNEVEFNSVSDGNKVFSKAAQYIHNFRNGSENYPIYISDIDISHSLFSEKDQNQLQTIHYLNYKKKIEAKLNLQSYSSYQHK